MPSCFVWTQREQFSGGLTRIRGLNRRRSCVPASTQTAPCRGSPHRLGKGGVGRGWQDIKHEVGAETKGADERGIWEGPTCTTLRTWCPGRGLLPLCAPLPLSKQREEIISRERMESHKVKMIVPLTRVFLRTQRRGGHCPPKQFLGRGWWQS